jgi:hypothetical protein
MATAVLAKATAAGGRGIRLIRWLMVINLALVGLQPVSAGFILSGYGRATAVHGAVAVALLVGALIQTISGMVLWLQSRVPPWVAGLGAALFVIVVAQIGLGYNDWHWLHVPMGVGIFGGLTRQLNRLHSA